MTPTVPTPSPGTSSTPASTSTSSSSPLWNPPQHLRPLVFCLHKNPAPSPKSTLATSPPRPNPGLLSAVLGRQHLQQLRLAFRNVLCKAVNLGIKMNAYCSIYFLVLVSIDRYIALVHAMSHGRMRRPNVLNPVLYVLVGKNFRKKMSEVFHQWAVVRPVTSDSTRSHLSSTLKTTV
ncbi:hypothetical protein WMY93_032178 [Mugilogobius chulae]|uniref:G-protein coupled receptors family 1 profile domain-containing protein n=1 Tax=Mugilogobius chulae TaxID=88201 RepID=A0AAW0MKN6_9GOBI